MDMHVSSSAYDISMNRQTVGSAVRLTNPHAARINQAAEELADANDALVALCDATVVEQDEIEMCLANERLASAKRHFAAAIQSAGIDPDTLRRAVEA